MTRVRPPELLLGLALALSACQAKDLGALLDERRCTTDCAVDAGFLPDASPACETSTATIECGLGICARSTLACFDNVLGSCVPGEPMIEACNDLDDDCDGVVDNGCDDDHDGYCDAMMVVTSSPAICKGSARGALDCDDDNPQRHPNRTEICDDAIDNDCNDFADYLDINGCVHVTASIQDSDGVITLEHGTSQVVQAVLTPPTMELSREWAVVSAVPDTHCQPSDVTLAEPIESPANTRRRVSILDDPSRLDCAYRLELLIGGVTADAIELRMRNTRPRVDEVVGATLDDQTLVLTTAAGIIPRLVATLPTDPDTPVTVTWVGRDANLLDCTAPCTGVDLRLRSAPAPGTYLFTLNAKDSFDGVNRGRALRLEVRPCTWLRQGGTGSGTGPAQAQAYGTLAAAAVAAGTAGTDVCLAGTGRITVGSNVVLPNGVGLVGGFSSAGLPTASLGALRVNNGAHLGFAAGYTGSIRRLVVDAVNANTLFEVSDASPSFHGVDLVLPAAVGARAIRVSSSGAANATVRLGSSSVRSNGASVDAVALEAVGLGAGTARLVWNGASEVNLSGCTGVCRGIWLHGSVSALLNAERIDVESSGSGGRAVGIEVASEGPRVATADISAINQIIARTSQMDPADATVAIRLIGTQGLRIANNNVIGAITQVAGRRFSAAIADGELSRDGAIERGDSRDLSITGNRQLSAGRAPYAYADAVCEDEAEAREGSDIAVGVLLVGTSTVDFSNNGSNASRDTGVFGGASSAAWDDATRVLPPSVPGLWTVDTNLVQVTNNELRAGVLSTDPRCPPSVLPTVAAVRDGLGPRAPQPLGSRGLRLSRNGIVTGRRASFDAVPELDHVPTRLVELYGGPGGSVYLANNYLAATRGAAQIPLYAWQVEGLALWNNVLEVDSLGPAGTTTIKQGLVLEAGPNGSVELLNNIILLRQEAGDASDPVALVVRESPAPFLRLSHNLLFVEAAERGADGAYVELDDLQRYSRATFPSYAAQIGAEQNLILPPLFRAQTLEHRRSITRLSASSPARDQGLLEGAPTIDRFGTARPIGPGVDIGHHELSP